MEKIKLGIVRADTHGYYFGIMMDQCDPLLLQKNDYVVHHYASDIYSADVLSNPKVDGFDIVKIYDSEPEKAQRFSETFKGKPQVCEKLEDMADGVDAIFLGDCDGSGVDHLKLAEPFLKKGIPIFVDKPFASTLKDAEKIVRLAEENNTLMFNASILSHVPAAAHFKQRFVEIAQNYWPVSSQLPSLPLGLGVVKGVGGAFFTGPFGSGC